MTFHSEFGEDKWITENLKLPEKGIYLDLGCAHPYFKSNTAFLRQMGWTGVGVDADPRWADDWTDPFVAAIVSIFPRIGFIINQDNPYVSRTTKNGGGFQLAKHASQILEECGIDHLDFLSLDLEGHEYHAFLTLEREHLPTIIISEYDTEGIGKDMRVHDYLTATDYQLVHTTTANHIFLRNE